MPTRLTSDDFKLSLNDHAASKAADAQAKYGPLQDLASLERMLQDRSLVRYPCRLAFTHEGLQEGECAHPVALGERPEEGYCLVVHPFFESRPQAVIALVLYQLVLVNYGDFAGPDDAETFGAGVLGMDRESYYRMVCDYADELATPPPPSPACGCGGGCGA